MKKLRVALFILFAIGLSSFRWGFFAHQQINRLAVFTIPPALIGFYKKHIVYLTENAINPDQRRYAVDYEAPRHYIDLDVYGDSALTDLPHNWFDAVEKYSEDTLHAYGIVPWHITLMKHQLTKAFEDLNLDRILRYSAEIGHYIADANVPLHTTENYNGQLTGQYGIHGFWESRLPELFSEEYDFFVGRAEYEENVQERAWEAVTAAHMALDSVLAIEKSLTARFGEGKKYAYEQRGNRTVKVYAYKFSQAYHQLLSGMVERRMCASIKMVGDLWFTCWVDAGQPDIEVLLSLELGDKDKKKLKEEKKQWENRTVKSRAHN